ncbi:hypothetical protein VNI00_017981 [Paramarasmius palmivorus]|uniref:Uncharacterized protein n=1 Tax=Paramarasmius palmivorus TaxID=297713 RepID=A0AAW0B0I2_9AGAR
MPSASSPHHAHLQSIKSAPTSSSGLASTSPKFASPLVTKALDEHRPKPFLAQNGKTTTSPTPINCSTALPTSNHVESSTARPQQPLSASTSNASFQTPCSSSLALSTPARSARNTHRVVTPFKKGMGSGESGRTTLDKQAIAIRSSAVATLVTKERFDTCSISPEIAAELQPNPTAIHVPRRRHHTSDSTPLTTTSGDFSAKGVFQRLQATNYYLAKKEWGVNHRNLILWKLAGMVASLDHERRIRDVGLGVNFGAAYCEANWRTIEFPPESEVTVGGYKLRANIERTVHVSYPLTDVTLSEMKPPILSPVEALKIVDRCSPTISQFRAQRASVKVKRGVVKSDDRQLVRIRRQVASRVYRLHTVPSSLTPCPPHSSKLKPFFATSTTRLVLLQTMSIPALSIAVPSLGQLIREWEYATK